MQFCCVKSIFPLIQLVLMALFCAAVTRDSISLLKSPFCCNILSFAISQACRLKYPYSCFSSHFCLLVFIFCFVLMLPLLPLAAVISLFLLFLMYFSGLYIDEST